MIAPKRFDFICELLVMLMPALMIVVGGPVVLAGALQAFSVPSDVALRFVGLLPWWLPLAAAAVAWIGSKFLMMCYPTLQLPTTANTTVTMRTPDLGPEHPSTEMKVETNGGVAPPSQP